MPEPRAEGPFLVCRKSGRIVGIRPALRRAPWLLPVVGVLALVWYLLRVLPKPGRADYPCQKVALSLAATFLGQLAAIPLTLLLLRSGRAFVRRHPQGVAMACLALGVTVAFAALRQAGDSSPAWIPTDPPTSPVGVARGICSGRVVWVRSPAAAKWDGRTGKWWENTGTDQAAVDAMLSAALQSLSATGSDTAAWNRIFRYFNQTHGRGDTGYAAGERVAIKVNFNNTGNYWDIDHGIDASPHSVLAMLRQLTLRAGVPEGAITVYEAPNTAPSRVIPDRVYAYCHTVFPSVVFADCTGTNGRTLVAWATNAVTFSVANGCGRNLPTLVTGATYIVNMALFKGHSTAGVTLSAKNHYGSINTREHTFIKASASGMGAYSPFVDLVGHRDLGGKTLLFMLDGLYGMRSVGDAVNSQAYSRWPNLFGGAWSASYLVSLDPVALDSVALDFLRCEFGDQLGGGGGISANCDNYLHEAARANSPPSGTVYQPNGAPLPSLGVHEHWNSAAQKKYSRNLGTSNGIELVSVYLSPTNFMMDGGLDSPGYVLATNGVRALSAAVCGTRLYVAAPWAGNSATTDVALLVTDAPGALGAAPWGKAGQVAMDLVRKPWLIQRGTATAVWSNGGASARAAAAITNGCFEGWLDLAQVFTNVPPVVYVALAPYPTNSAGALLASQQVPPGNGNGNIESNEFLAVPVNGVRDENLDAIPDVLDPARQFQVREATAAPEGFVFTWPTLPRHAYRLLCADDPCGSFTLISNLLWSASGQFGLAWTDAPSASASRFLGVQHAAP